MHGRFRPSPTRNKLEVPERRARRPDLQLAQRSQNARISECSRWKMLVLIGAVLVVTGTLDLVARATFGVLWRALPGTFRRGNVSFQFPSSPASS